MKNRPDRSATRRVGMSACAMLLGMMLSSGAAAQDAVSFGKKCSASFKSGVDLDDVVDGGPVCSQAKRRGQDLGTA